MVTALIPTGHRWTPERDELLRRVYLDEGRHAAAAALGVTVSAVKNRVHQLDLHRPPRLWTATEDAVLRSEYAAGQGAAAIAGRLGSG